MGNPMHSEPSVAPPSRDELAESAMSTLLRSDDGPSEEEERAASYVADVAEHLWSKRIARKAYALADAMLLERGKAGG